ncbi:MAG: TIGR01777 family protein [Bacteroidetes bacterium]|nr:TIGR01777 family protein [Bacteroidota bacterium]
MHWLSHTGKSFPDVKVFEWNVTKRQIEENAFENVNTVIALNGCGIVDKRWTDQRKKEIIDSRVDGIKLLHAYIQKKNIPVKNFISTSATGAYGIKSRNEVSEQDAFTSGDFLSDSCRMWEDANLNATTQLRKVALRLGIVFTTKGGALYEMLRTFNLFTGVTFDNGNMQTPWVHIDDVCNAFIFAIENENMIGPYNCVSPETATNKTIIKNLMALKTSFFCIPAPAVALKLILQERALLLLQSLVVKPDKLINAGFRFSFADLSVALRDLIKNEK